MVLRNGFSHVYYFGTKTQKLGVARPRRDAHTAASNMILLQNFSFLRARQNTVQHGHENRPPVSTAALMLFQCRLLSKRRKNSAPIIPVAAPRQASSSTCMHHASHAPRKNRQPGRVCMKPDTTWKGFGRKIGSCRSSVCLGLLWRHWASEPRRGGKAVVEYHPFRRVV